MVFGDRPPSAENILNAQRVSPSKHLIVFSVVAQFPAKDEGVGARHQAEQQTLRLTGRAN